MHFTTKSEKIHGGLKLEKYHYDKNQQNISQCVVDFYTQPHACLSACSRTKQSHRSGHDTDKQQQRSTANQRCLGS